LNIRVVGSGAVAGTDYDQLISQEMYAGDTVSVSGLANATLHVTIPTGLALRGDVLTIVSSVGGLGATGTLQNFTGSSFGKVVFDNYAVADVNYGQSAITLSRLATAGDITRDGYVDGSDLNIMLSNWNSGTAGALTYARHDFGDASHDGFVDGSDLNILLSHWNEGISGQAGVGSAAAATPEPMTMTLLGLGAIGLLRRRRSN
jgi:MYXO-CTERM domain-containing protein